MTNADHQAAWRERNPELARQQSRERTRRYRANGREKPRGPRHTNHPFIALDGEGAGYDVLGRQYYKLLRAEDSTGKLNKFITYNTVMGRITTQDALEFILRLPSNATLVGFFFGYDVTMILHGLPPDRKRDLFGDKSERKNNYTYWESFGIEYVPKQYFRVCRIDRNTLKVIPGTARTVNECGTFYQKAFVEALRDWSFDKTDKAIFDEIAVNKDRRSSFTEIGKREAEYCRNECWLLARLMEQFRETCKEVKIVPRYWRGAGHIAARLHEQHKTPKRKDQKRSKIFDDMTQAAYYGGRFEVTTIGRVKGKIYEYDINSAYPTAMLSLPCPMHGKWQKFGKGMLSKWNEFNADELNELFIADVAFQHDENTFLCGFPIRQKGRLFFPKDGCGVYWSPEIRAAVNAGAKIRIYGGYRYIKKCDCHPYDWVNELYEKRTEIGKQTKGYPIKLGLNGLYGKFAQRIGSAPWRDYVAAGLLTAITRATLIEAYCQAPRQILYIATDAIYSKVPLQLDIGKRLGQWEENIREDIFIVQPGIYWSGNTKPKTRGIPRSIIIENRAAFEQAWDKWLEDGAENDPPVVPVFVNQFIGLRAALARGKPELAGTWLSDLRELTGDETIGIRNIDFDWYLKRKPYGLAIINQSMITQPFNGNQYLRSESYDGNQLTDFAAQLIEREDDIDFEPWGNSGE